MARANTDRAFADSAQDLWVLLKGDGKGSRTRHAFFVPLFVDKIISNQPHWLCDVDPKKLAKLARLSATTPPLHVVENFIIALTAANDGECVLGGSLRSAVLLF